MIYYLELRGRSGRDIAYFSRQRDEKEVLLLPGAAFRIDRRDRGLSARVGGQELRYDMVWATETTA